MRRFPCCCEGCLTKLAEPIETRYTGLSDKCVYWDVFKKNNGETGYNDWKLVEIIPKPKGYKEEDADARKAVTIAGVGKRMAELVEIGGYGAYPVDDERYEYYVVKWTGLPYEVEENISVPLGNETFYLRKGETVCKGVWLEKVPRTGK